MYYTVYEVTNKECGKTYRGKHQTNDLNDGYLGSGKYLKRAINKHGENVFERTQLFLFDNKNDMDVKESEFVNEEYLKSGNTYNLKLGGEGGFDHLNDGSNEHIERCKRGRIAADKVLREKYGENFYSIAYKDNYKKGLAVWKKSDDPEIKRRRSEISGNTFRGKHHTDESKNAIGKANSISLLGDNNWNYGRCWVYSLGEQKNMSILKTELDEYILRGWIKGRKMKF